MDFTNFSNTLYFWSVIFCGILLQSVPASYENLKALLLLPFHRRVSLYSFDLVFVSSKIQRVVQDITESDKNVKALHRHVFQEDPLKIYASKWIQSNRLLSDIQTQELYSADTKQNLFWTGHEIGKADYLSGVRLVALKRAVVVCFLVREEEATA